MKKHIWITCLMGVLTTLLISGTVFAEGEEPPAAPEERSEYVQPEPAPEEPILEPEEPELTAPNPLEEEVKVETAGLLPPDPELPE